MKPDHCPLHGIPLQYDGSCWTCEYNRKYKFQLVEEPKRVSRMTPVESFFYGAGIAAIALLFIGLIQVIVS